MAAAGTRYAQSTVFKTIQHEGGEEAFAHDEVGTGKGAVFRIADASVRR
jgi:hypothetical protein